MRLRIGKRWLCQVAGGVALLEIALLCPGAWAEPDLSRALTVEECVEIALRQSHSLGQSEAAVRMAKGSSKMSMRAILPSLSASASWTQDRLDEERIYVIQGRVFGPSDVFYDARMSLRASQPLLDLEGFKEWQGNRGRLEAARLDLEAAREDVEVSTREQFYGCLAAIRLAEVEENAVEVAREQLRRAETLFNLGSVARSDVLQARVNLAESEMNAINRRNVVRVEHSRLALIMGLDPQIDLEIDPALAIPDRDPGGDIADWIGKALAQRPEFAAASARLRAAELSESAAKLRFLPTVGASGSWSRAGTSDDTFIRDAPTSSNWSVSLGVSLTLFDGLQREGRIDSAIGERRSRRESLEQLEKEIALQVKDSYLSIRKERECLRAAQTSVGLAQENLRLQKALYESGAGTLLEWDNARLDLRRAMVSLIQAEIYLILSHVRFLKAVGE